MTRRWLSVVAIAMSLASGASAQQPAAQTSPSCVHAAVLVTVDGATGSGTMIDARGYVLTNHHVVAPVLAPGFDGPSVRARAHLRVQVPVGSSLDATDVYEAEIVASDVTLDLALVRITGRPGEAPRNDLHFDAIALANSDALPTGTAVRVLGYPFGHRILTVIDGTITGRREQTDGTVEWVTTNASFNPGNSGGTLVDAACQLVGVPTLVFRGGLSPVNLARPIDARVRAYVEGARADASRRGTLGQQGVATFGAGLGPSVDKVPPPTRGSRSARRRR